MPRSWSVSGCQITRELADWGSSDTGDPWTSTAQVMNGEIVVDMTRQTVQALAMSRVWPLTGWEQGVARHLWVDRRQTHRAKP